AESHAETAALDDARAERRFKPVLQQSSHVVDVTLAVSRKQESGNTPRCAIGRRNSAGKPAEGEQPCNSPASAIAPTPHSKAATARCGTHNSVLAARHFLVQYDLDGLLDRLDLLLERSATRHLRLFLRDIAVQHDLGLIEAGLLNQRKQS